MPLSTLWKLEPIFLTLYAACMVLLLVYACGQLHLLWRSRSKRTQVAAHSLRADNPKVELPFVTIQLPVYNEQYVIARLLQAVAKMDYPKNRFEIQLLDDSGDETTSIATTEIERIRKSGIQIEHIRRKNREGFKAGALDYGMKTARGSFIAIFDADFIPNTDFLRETIPYFSDPKVAVVQARWGHQNEHASLMTRIQAFFLNLHFGFEQPRRDAANIFLNFNGTCGIWRTKAIEDSGGWKARTITEDIDLSYRAQMKGWKIKYLGQYETPGELPEEMSGFRTQQYRWMKGGAENAKLHVLPLLRSKWPAHVRWHGVHHLLSGSVYLLILSALLLSTPLAYLKNRWIAFDYVDFGMPFLLSTGALFLVFYKAQIRRPRGVLGKLKFIGMMLLFLVFTMGLAVHNGSAVISGWLGRKSPFVRTPKYGNQRWAFSEYVRRRLDPKIMKDIFMLFYLGVGLVIGWQRGQFAFFPIQLMAVMGIMWVTGLSLMHPIKAALRPRMAQKANKVAA